MGGDQTMADEEAIQLEGFGMKGSLSGRKIFSEHVLVLILFCAMALLLYNDHTANEAQHLKLLEAIAENTYVLALPQADRERLNIAMPESLRRKIRQQ